MGNFKRRYRRIFRVITLCLLIITVVNYTVFIPEWLSTGTKANFQIWFPRFGVVFYPIVHYKIDLLAFLIACVWINRNYLVATKMYLKTNKLVAIYGISLLLLIVQFYYNYNYTEFYPSVMMPSFKHGIHDTSYKHQYVTVVAIDDKNKIHTFRGENLFLDLPMGKIGSIQASKKLLHLNNKSVTNWTRKKTKRILGIQNIQSIEVKFSEDVFNIYERISKSKMNHQ